MIRTGDEDTIQRIDNFRALKDGGRIYTVRGRFWGMFAVAALGASALVSVQAPTESTGEDAERTAEVDERVGPFGNKNLVRITGTASSTGVDHHETEMSREALVDMADQFRAGVAYAPTHGEREWHQIVGQTISAEVRAVKELVNAADEDEPAYILVVETDVDATHPRGKDLVEALRAGRPVGQSIGGWFLEIRIVEDRHGRIVRVIIDKVQLDHLAATRTPSNMDSDDLTLKDRLTSGLRSFQEQESRALVDAIRAGNETDLRLMTSMRVMEQAVRDAQLDAVIEEGHIRKVVVPGTRHLLDVQMADDGNVWVLFETHEDEGDDEDRSNDLDGQGNPADEGASVPDARNNDHDSGAEAPETNEGDAMDEEALRAMFGEFVGPIREKLEAVDTRLQDLERAEPEPTDPPEPAQVQAREIITPDPELEQLRTKLAETEAERDAERTRAERATKLTERLAGRAVRETKAFQDPDYYTRMALDDGDFGDLIERAAEEGNAPTLVHVSRKSKKVARVRDCDDEQTVTIRQTRDALIELCRAAERDGIIRAPRRGVFR